MDLSEHDPSRVAVWIDNGLYDPAATGAAERLEVLSWIEAHGATIPQMVAACEARQLLALVGDLRLRPGVHLSLTETAARTGLDIELVRRLRRAGGLPDVADDEKVYSDADAEMFALFALASGFFSTDELVHYVRVVGGSLRRIAEAASEMFMRDVEAGLSEKGTELDRAKANLAAVELVQSAVGMFEPMFRAHLETGTASSRRARSGTFDYSTTPLTVGFVDLNGFTARSGAMSASELLELVVEFEAAAVDLVTEHGGRLIKLIGDEVMFSTVDSDAACRIGSKLIERAGSWGSNARGGVAQGLVITSGGDIYGETVNLASRIADLAVPGELLVNSAVTSSASGMVFEPAGRRQLKGFADPVQLWSLKVT
jgi:adenylate cyclase